MVISTPRTYTSKEITGIVTQLQPIAEKEIIISCDSVNYIPAQDIIELYLKFRGVNKISWKDIHQEKSNNSTFQNIGNILRELFSFPFTFWSVNRKIKTIPTQPQFFSLQQQGKIVYLRTDHWFNLISGGSVGHVSGVVNELNKLNQLQQLFTTDSLYEVDASIKQKIISPNYSSSRNIPELPALAYNVQLYETILSQFDPSSNLIYQRLSLGNFTGILLKYHYSIPLILEYNGSEIWASEKWGGRKLKFLATYKTIEQKNLEHADLIVVVSDPLKEELIGRGISANRILVNPNGVNTDKFNAENKGLSVREKYQLHDKKVFGFIGTFAEWHGVLFMVNSIVAFFKKYPALKTDIRFLLIGAGNLLTASKKVIEENHLQEQVIFTDKIAQHLSPEYLAACDYYLSPHVPNPDGTKFFGSPTKLFEYMAMRRPIIASNLDQIGEILNKHDAAVLIEPNNIDQFCEAIYTVQQNKERNHIIAQHAYDAIQEHYSWKKHVCNIIDKIASL